jgi:U3 small nucleolar RNA-associated protein 10
VYNADEFVYAFLPLYDEQIFLRVLSLLPSPPSNKVLNFLQPYLKPPTNPPKQAITYAAANTPAVFTAFGNYFLRIGALTSTTPDDFRTFWLGVLAQAVHSKLDAAQAGNPNVQRTKQEAAMLEMLPIVEKALSLQVPEMVLGGCVLITIIVSRSPCPEVLLDGFLRAVGSNLSEDMLDKQIKCIAAIISRKESTKLPNEVTKALLSIPSVGEVLISLAGTHNVEVLAYGIALRLARTIAEADSECEHELALLQQIVTGMEFTKREIRLILKPLMVRMADGDADEDSSPWMPIEVVSLFKAVNETGKGKVIKKAATKHGVSSERVKSLLRAASPMEAEFSNLTVQPAQPQDIAKSIASLDHIILGDGILADKSSQSTQQVLDIFTNPNLSIQDAQNLLNHPKLRKPATIDGDSTFISLCLRLACSNYSQVVRLAALQEIGKTMEEVMAHANIDFHIILPYLLCLFADTSRSIRTAAVQCVAVIGNTAAEDQRSIWGRDSLYPEPSNYHLQSSLVSAIVSQILDMSRGVESDPRHVLRIAESLFGMQTELSTAFGSFLATHASLTGVLPVRMKLIAMLRLGGKKYKVGHSTSWISENQVRKWIKAPETSSEQGVDYGVLLRSYLSLIDNKAEGGAQFLHSLLLDPEIGPKAAPLVNDHIEKYWPEFKRNAKTALLATLFRSALENPHSANIRSLALDNHDLAKLIQQLPLIAGATETSPAKKRKTSIQDTSSSDPMFEHMDDLTHRYALVLELLDSANVENYSDLLDGLFGVLEQLQLLSDRSGMSMDYMYNLCLRHILPVLENQNVSQGAPSPISNSRASLVVGIMRGSSSTEVKNTSLLVISRLVSLAPELILNSVLEIFAFMSETIVREGDASSVHIIDKTVSAVVPLLVDSLTQRGKNVVEGAAGILVSFTAAFEYIPHFRREDFFKRVLEALGPREFLATLVVLLIDKHDTDEVIRQFIPNLLLSYRDDTLTLKVCTGLELQILC